MTEEPDFEAMSILQLLQYDQSLKDQDKGFGSAERLEKWLNAIRDTLPFGGIIEHVKSVEADLENVSDQFYELQAQFARLINVLDKEAGGIKVSLKEWIKR